MRSRDQADTARPQEPGERRQDDPAAERAAARRRFLGAGALAPVILTLGHGTSLAAQQFMGASVCLSMGGTPKNSSGNAQTTRYICE